MYPYNGQQPQQYPPGPPQYLQGAPQYPPVPPAPPMLNLNYTAPPPPPTIIIQSNGKPQ